MENDKTLNVIFPNLHFDRDWNITDGSSLWSIFILNNIVETLFRVKNNSDLGPALASGWTFSDDKKTLTLSLSDKYRFHDGTPITPHDIWGGLKRAFSSRGKKHSEIEDSLISKNIEESIELKDDKIIIRLKTPLNALIYKLSVQEMGIAPQSYPKEKKGQDFKEALKNLSGPYRVVEFTQKKMSVEQSPGHPLLHEKSVPKADFIQISDIDEGIEYYKKSDNVILIGSSYKDALKYENLEGKKRASTFALTEFILPNIRSKNLDTTLKRKALFSMLKKAFGKVEINDDLAQRTDQIFTKNNLSRIDENKTSELYEIEKNKGPSLKNPLKLSLLLFDFVKDSPIPFLIKEESKKMGLDIEIIAPGNQEVMRRLKKGNYDLMYLYSGVSALDPIVELIYLFSHPITDFFREGGNALTLLDAAKKETNRTKYISLLKDIHFEILKDYKILPLIHARMIYCAKGDYHLKDLAHFDGGFNLWDWHRK
ncbi:MAG: ABC transporter substrate-binding protein [Bacteriovoracales bacterium]|nr:ABC transporter substrate-binding protein [Bacteriovoracales bacterium]